MSLARSAFSDGFKDHRNGAENGGLEVVVPNFYWSASNAHLSRDEVSIVARFVGMSQLEE